MMTEDRLGDDRDDREDPPPIVWEAVTERAERETAAEDQPPVVQVAPAPAGA